MINIIIPNNNLAERKYILEIIFYEFLGVELQVIEKHDCQDWIIQLKNKKELVIKDTFFNKFPNDLEYLKYENIPNAIEDIDIFAACFFMLTRWEEYVNKIRDKHDRFPATESLAFKQGFLNRPIVNDYVESLKNMLLKLDDSLLFKTIEKKIFLTHDVDRLYFWKNWKQVLKVMSGDILKRKSSKLAIQNLAEYYLIKTKRIKDPFDTFNWLMDKSESINEKSRFYFMSGGFTIYDNKYKTNEPKALELIEKIKKRGHVIGFHPSYNAYNDTQQFKQEKETLENVTGQRIYEGREHYLRFEVPTTWQIWEDNGMLIDSTCGYADKVGYRCGTGNEYSVFNILTRKKLNLKERPLVLMDCSLFDYNSFSYDEALNCIQNLKNYNFTMLWHNSYIKHHDFYDQTINLIRGNKC
ncbi:polysaccharide deacetylase family protein [Halarcobacter sp.]|uniref:polysaccharide deacetylase family protein n=1 Tax=Halarcobacter sp. TaxID=2321133 RepID=UPI003A8D1297